jgi:hypothetical protein
MTYHNMMKRLLLHAHQAQKLGLAELEAALTSVSLHSFAAWAHWPPPRSVPQGLSEEYTLTNLAVDMLEVSNILNCLEEIRVRQNI